MREYLLKDVAFIKNGYAFDSKKYSNKGIPIIRIADIKEKIDLKNCVFINGKVDNEFLVKKGSLLIALSGATTGKMGVYFEDKIVYLNQRICSVYTKKEDVLQEYLVYFLKSMQKKIIKNSYGGAQPNISSRWIENIKIKVPDIRVQKKISKRLELLENNIDYRKKQLNYLKELSKSLFTRMFGDIKTNDKNWEIKKLGEVVQTQYGTSKKATSIVGEFPILRMNNITYSGEMDYKDLKYIELSDSEKEKFLLKKGELLFNRTNSKELVGKTGLFNLDIPMAFAGYLIRIKPSNLIHSKFLLFFMNSEFMKKLLYNKAKNIVGMANINAKELEDFSIILPPIELQNKFAERVEKIEKLSFEIEKSIKEAENLYNSLMNKYFD